MYRSDLLQGITDQSTYSDMCLAVLNVCRKYHVFTGFLPRKTLSFSTRYRTMMIKVKEPKMEGYVSLVSGHEATTLNVFKCPGLGNSVEHV